MIFYKSTEIPMIKKFKYINTDKAHLFKSNPISISMYCLHKMKTSWVSIYNDLWYEYKLWTFNNICNRLKHNVIVLYLVMGKTKTSCGFSLPISYIKFYKTIRKHFLFSLPENSQVISPVDNFLIFIFSLWDDGPNL